MTEANPGTNEAVAVLRKFRDDSKRALDTLLAKNADPADIEHTRAAYVEAEEALHTLVLELAEIEQPPQQQKQ